MKNIVISADSTSKELEPFARAIHEVIRLPVIVASLNKDGIILDRNNIEDYDYSGPIFDKVLTANKPFTITPKTGKYKGVPFIVAPIKNEDGEIIAAVGVVDLYGIIDIGELFNNYPEIIHQTEACFRKIYGDELPTYDDY